MTDDATERRNFLVGLGLASAAGLAGCATAPAPGAAPDEWSPDPSPYGLAPGFTYLNTRSAFSSNTVCCVETWRL